MSSDIAKLCEAKGVKCDARYGKNKEPAQWEHAAHSYRVTLRYQGRQLSTDFHCGAALGEPTAADVLSCLLSDMSSFDNARSFEEWASEFGYDPDSRAAEKVYKACAAIAPKVRRFLGDDLEAFLNAEH